MPLVAGNKFEQKARHKAAKAKQTITSLTTIIKKCRPAKKKSVKNYIRNLIAKAENGSMRGATRGYGAMAKVS